MSVVLTTIMNADQQLRYPSVGELEQIKNFMEDSALRLKVAKTLSDANDRVVKQASAGLFQRRPDLNNPGGNAYGEKRLGSCIRDLGWYYRLITYSIVAGNNEPVERIGLTGIFEMYRVLEVPIPAMIESIRLLKKEALELLSPAEAEIAAPYFDYVIGAMQ
ncbi:allophycocyanin [Gloeobacter morelensis]|uniref:Allophycocyanin n=1 Tax=Gloeobacter morelensis MG652769 TaxID=2781736 RepID=A0ABY3PMS6_9CYAN|nr:allophycocyanin [Gloeobacter morelensis]UFP94909.1 allophycocyanin [Gloeobacter morelensis MG652769]